MSEITPSLTVNDRVPDFKVNQDEVTSDYTHIETVTNYETDFDDCVKVTDFRGDFIALGRVSDIRPTVVDYTIDNKDYQLTATEYNFKKHCVKNGISYNATIAEEYPDGMTDAEFEADRKTYPFAAELEAERRGKIICETPDVDDKVTIVGYLSVKREATVVHINDGMLFMTFIVDGTQKFESCEKRDVTCEDGKFTYDLRTK